MLKDFIKRHFSQFKILKLARLNVLQAGQKPKNFDSFKFKDFEDIYYRHQMLEINR
jgi:hypothetical protein